MALSADHHRHEFQKETLCKWDGLQEGTKEPASFGSVRQVDNRHDITEIHVVAPLLCLSVIEEPFSALLDIS